PGCVANGGFPAVERRSPLAPRGTGRRSSHPGRCAGSADHCAGATVAGPGERRGSVPLARLSSQPGRLMEPMAPSSSRTVLRPTVLQATLSKLTEFLAHELANPGPIRPDWSDVEWTLAK